MESREGSRILVLGSPVIIPVPATRDFTCYFMWVRNLVTHIGRT